MAMIPRSCGTHDGTFHADEVTACALLLFFDLIDKDKIFRTRDPEQLDCCEYVCDVGGLYQPELKRYDHHQIEYEGPWSSAGMVLHDLLERGVLTLEEHKHLNELLIIGVDQHDNGIEIDEEGVTTFSHVIANYNPIRYDAGAEERKALFMEAVTFAEQHISRLIERYRYNCSCLDTVKERMENDTICLLFDRAMPWIESFFASGGEEHEALFVIMPTGEHWKLRGIPPSFERRMEVRLPLPEAWAGHLERDLRDVCGIEGAVFCHKGRFISIWETKEAALEALEHTLRLHKEQSA